MFTNKPRPQVFLFSLLAGGLILLLSFTIFNTGAPGHAQGILSADDDSAVYLPVVFRPRMPTLFGIAMGKHPYGLHFDQVAQSGAYWLRIGYVEWGNVEPTEGARNWGTLDALESELLEAASKGMRVILIVTRTPGWAQLVPGSDCGPIKQSKFGAFGTFMRDLVNRYSAPPYNIYHYEIWNEPDAPVSASNPGNFFGCWADTSDPYAGGGYYGEMLKVVTPMMKSANGKAQVVFGGLLLECDPNLPGQTCHESRFLEGALRVGAGPYFDILSFHAYDWYGEIPGVFGNLAWNSLWNTTGPATHAKAQFLRNVLTTYGYPNKPLVNTETALICGGPLDPSGQPPCEPDPSSGFELTKAYYAAQSYAQAIAENLSANMWFSHLGWRNSGLLYSDGSPRPAYNAFAFARDELRDSVSLGKITGYPGVSGYQFHRGDRKVWVLWSLDGANHNITLPGVPLDAFDVDGDSKSVAGTALTVTIEPTYLEWPP
jgi:hypothetical protein